MSSFLHEFYFCNHRNDCLFLTEFCFHRELLLKHLTFKDDNPEPIIELKRKRLATSVGRQPTKRLKLNDENDSKAVNVQSVDDKIKLVKKKKIVELSQEDLEKVSKLKMENLIKSFGRGSFDDFQKHCFNIMSENKELLKLADELTVEQANTEIWHQLRIGRITASRLYETSRCTMARGSLVDTFMGKRSGFSFAMMRGTILEEFVFLECQKEFPTLKHAGLVMNHEANPFYAASPDGICDDFVLEIKCPANANTHAQYIDIEKLSKKYFAQIQLQMFVTGRKKALLAVAALDFETTRGITKIWIPFDKVYIDDMIEQSIEFYEKCVFPALKRKFLR